MRVWHSSAGLDPAALEPGGDLVLQAPAGHGASLRQGVLVDDWLDGAARAEVDRAANRALAAWRERHDPALTLEGVCLPWVHEGELFADVFLREQRVVAGVLAAFANHPPRHVQLRGTDPALATALTAVMHELGVAAGPAVDPAPAPTYPIEFARSVRRNNHLAGAVRETLGLPARARGAVLIKPFWHLDALWERLLTEPGAAPVLDAFDLPRLPVRSLARAAVRGGWIGAPGLRLRRRSRTALAAALRGLPAPAGASPLERLTDERARAMLSQRAPDTGAQVDSLRRSFHRGRVRAVVMPSDGTPAGRMLAVAAREHGVRTVQVQHGFFSDLWRVGDAMAPYVDGLVADEVAVWSERFARVLAPQARGRVTCTGNPGWARVAPAPRHAGADGPSLVLVQPPIGATAAIDVRAPLRHARTTLGALARQRPGTVVLRPHPLDPTDFTGVAAGYPELRVSVDRERPIEELLDGAGLCVGPLSTATLQAAAALVPTVFLRALETPLPWPFDGSGDFPTALDGDELERLIPEVVAGRTSGAQAAREALGVREDALERVLDLALGG